jgi:lipoprotein-anchoring transpeptidase ErfK/SrfK
LTSFRKENNEEMGAPVHSDWAFARRMHACNDKSDARYQSHAARPQPFGECALCSVVLPVAYQRTVVEFHRKEAAGSIVIDTDGRYLYYVLAENKAIRYGVAVGEQALSWYGVAKIARKEEWPTWTPTAEIKRRLGNIPDFVEGGPHNPMGARGLYLYQGNKDTLFRIHGTNQPEYIGRAISSGCIRMTNEDVIDLYNRVKIGTIVVVLAPKQNDLPVSPRPSALGTDRSRRTQKKRENAAKETSERLDCISRPKFDDRRCEISNFQAICARGPRSWG